MSERLDEHDVAVMILNAFGLWRKEQDVTIGVSQGVVWFAFDSGEEFKAVIERAAP